MRRIKTYVMTVGVALSVAPIFNSALAQQGGNSTQLLLQVQTMRQEIAELRDMVERQQFQLRRLQKQVEVQSKRLGTVQGSDARAPGFVNDPNFGPTENSNIAPQVDGSLPQTNSVIPQTAPDSGAAIETGQQTSWDVARAQEGNDAYRPAGPNQAVSQSVVSAANQNAYGSTAPTQQVGQGSNYPPVVDRSFSTSTPTVPVTGAGTRQPSADGFQDVDGSVTGNTPVTNDQVSAASVSNSANQAAFNQQTLNQVSRAPVSQATGASSTNGVISVPAQAATVSPLNAIDASQIPSQATVSQTPASSNSQLATSQPAAPVSQAPAQAVIAEDDYYAQGFELLKQSKYEEAASIFEQQLQAHPRGDLADDAHYWIAEAMHVSRKLDVAKTHLKAIISDYPQSRRLPDAMLKTAYIEQSQGNQMEARILFQEIVNQHPQSDAAIAAKNQLAAEN